MNRRTLPLLLAALTLLLAACTMQVVTEVKSNGSATFTIEYGFTDQELESLAQFGMEMEESPCDLEGMMESDMPEDVSFSEEKRGDETWCTYTISFDSLEDMKDYFATEMSDMKVNRLEIADETFYYDITPGDTSGMEDAGMMPFLIEVKWILKAPGTVGENNATSVDGNTLTWNLLSSDLPDRFVAESAVGGGGLFGLDQTTLIILLVGGGCCVLAGIVVVVVLVVIVMRRKKSG